MSKKAVQAQIDGYAQAWHELARYMSRPDVDTLQDVARFVHEQQKWVRIHQEKKEAS